MSIHDLINGDCGFSSDELKNIRDWYDELAFIMWEDSCEYDDLKGY